MAITVPIVMTGKLDLENPAPPPDGGTVYYGGNVSCSLTSPWISLSASGGNVGVPKFCTLSIVTPDGTLMDGGDTLYDWGQLHAEFSMSANIKAVLQLRFEDPRHPFPEGVTGLGTPHGRPNNLRQVHGRYICVWTGNVTWSVLGSGWYQGFDGLDPGSTINIAFSDSGVTASGDGPVPDTAPPALVYFYQWDNGGLSYIGEPVQSIATLDGTFSVDSVPVNGRLERCNYTGTLPGYTPQTTANGNTVTGYWPVSPTSDSYTLWPSWVGKQTGTAEAYDGSSDLGLLGNPTLVVFGGDVREKATPHDSGTVTYENIAGPSPADHSPSTLSEPPTGTYRIAYPLEAYKRRNQPDYYGRWESLWVTLPEEHRWLAFKLMYTDTLTVDTCANTRTGTTVNLGPVSAFDWTAGSGVTMSVAGGYRRAVVSGSPADPALRRNLWDDWQDMAADPSAYRDAAGTPSQVSDYIANRKTWYQIRKRINANADIANWGNHRWLKIIAKSDSARTFTLRCLSANVGIADNFRLGMLSTDAGAPDPGDDESVRVIEVTQTVVQGDVEGLTLGTSDTTLYVDLAELADRMGSNLAHVTGFEFRDLEPGGTYDFKSVSLCSGLPTGTHAVNESLKTWGFWTGVPYADDECVVPVVDGRVCCLQDNINEGTESPYVLTWIERYRPVVEPEYSPREGDETKTLDMLREDIGFQEGFSVDESDVPVVEGTTAYDWAIFLDHGWHSAADSYSAYASIKCADMVVPAVLREVWACKGYFRGQARGVSVEAADNWPAADVHVKARAVDDAGERHLIGTTSTSDARGAWDIQRLPQTRNGKHEGQIDRNKGTLGNPDYWPDDLPHLPYYSELEFSADDLLDTSSQPVVDAGDVVNLSVLPSLISGNTEDVAVGGVSLWTAETGWMYRAYSSGPSIVLERRSLDAGDWQTVGTKAGAYPCVGGGPDGAVLVVYESAGSVRLWTVEEGTDVSVATGKKPFVRWSPSGQMEAIAYWASNKIYVLCRDPLGQTMHGGAVEVVTAPEQTAALDWRRDGTLEMVYSDGTSVQMLTSTNDGGTWA